MGIRPPDNEYIPSMELTEELSTVVRLFIFEANSKDVARHSSLRAFSDPATVFLIRQGNADSAQISLCEIRQFFHSSLPGGRVP